MHLNLNGICLKAQDLAVGYGKRTLLKDLNFCIKKGRTYLITGENGCGKSTLIKTMLGQVPILKGTMIKSPDTFADNRHVGYLPQKFINSLPHSFTALNLLYYTVNIHDSPFSSTSRKDRMDTIYCKAKSLSITHILNRPISTLSGGEIQMVRIMQMLINRCYLLIMDEPFNNLDAVYVRRILRMLETVRQKSNLTVIVTTHSHVDAILDNMNAVERICL